MSWQQWPLVRDLVEFYHNLRREAQMQALVLPINEVLFPDGVIWVRLPLQPWADCLQEVARAGSAVIVCLDRYANNRPMQEFESVGVMARVTELRRDDKEVAVRLHGRSRFRVLNRQKMSGLWYVQGQMLEEFEEPLDTAYQPLAAMLELMLTREALLERDAYEPLLASSRQVSYRLAERLPMNAVMKVKLLELDDPQDRLRVLLQVLQRRGLVSPATEPASGMAELPADKP